MSTVHCPADREPHSAEHSPRQAGHDAGRGPDGVHSPPTPPGLGSGAPLLPGRSASWEPANRRRLPRAHLALYKPVKCLKGPRRPGRGLQAGGWGAAAIGGFILPSGCRRRQRRSFSARLPPQTLNPTQTCCLPSPRGRPLQDRVQSGSLWDRAPHAAQPHPWEAEIADHQPPGQPGTPFTQPLRLCSPVPSPQC